MTRRRDRLDVIGAHVVFLAALGYGLMQDPVGTLAALVIIPLAVLVAVATVRG